jgi:hypothetical protein
MGIFNSNNNVISYSFVGASLGLMLLTWVVWKIWERSSKERWYAKWRISKQEKQCARREELRERIIPNDGDINDQSITSNSSPGLISCGKWPRSSCRDLERGIIENESAETGISRKIMNRWRW